MQAQLAAVRGAHAGEADEVRRDLGARLAAAGEAPAPVEESAEGGLYVVERLLASRQRRGRTEYLVRLYFILYALYFTGAPPVLVCWGSMLGGSAAAMAALAVASLRGAGARGVVQAGV